MQFLKKGGSVQDQYELITELMTYLNEVIIDDEEEQEWFYMLIVVTQLSVYTN